MYVASSPTCRLSSIFYLTFVFVVVVVSYTFMKNTLQPKSENKMIYWSFWSFFLSVYANVMMKIWYFKICFFLCKFCTTEYNYWLWKNTNNIRGSAQQRKFERKCFPTNRTQCTLSLSPSPSCLCALSHCRKIKQRDVSRIPLKEPPGCPGTSETSTRPPAQSQRSGELRSWCIQKPAGHICTPGSRQTHHRQTRKALSGFQYWSLLTHSQTYTYTLALTHITCQRNQWTANLHWLWTK